MLVTCFVAADDLIDVAFAHTLQLGGLDILPSGKYPPGFAKQGDEWHC